MAVTPNTVLKLLKCPLELDNLNQLTFANADAQYNYFNSLPQIEIDNITYQRKDNVVRFPAHIDTIIHYNYVMYQNSNYSNKWFYAYIDKMEYLNDSTTLITISTDCYQTWMFDINIKRSLVVREHTNDDTIGSNIVPEGLELGTMIMTNYTPITYLRDIVDSGNDFPENYVIVVGATIELDTTHYAKDYGGTIASVYSGVTYYCFPTGNDVNIMLSAVNAGGQTNMEDIVSIFMAPKSLCMTPNEAFDDISTSYGSYYVHKITVYGITYFRTIDYNVTRPTSIDGYTPVNKKLLTGEFNSLEVTNYTGLTQNYRYEFFKNNQIIFRMRGVIAPGCPITMYPTNYLSAGNDSEYNAGCYSIQAPKLPICNWNSDQYTNWLAATSASRGVNLVTSAVKTIAGAAMIATGAGSVVGAGLIASGVSQYANEFATLVDHQHDANANSGNMNQADTNYSTSKVFGAYQKCITNQFARKIDRYFNAVGYKTLECKIPNITGRLNWNYVQTQAVAITGDIPQEDLQVIKDMFNNGVTFWHNPATFLDYSQNNGII